MNRTALISPILLAKEITDGVFRAPKHLRFIEKKILETILKKNGRLIINMPPRHGKSELVSVWLPAWFIMNYPKKRLILTSYGDDLAKSFSRRARDVVKSFGPSMASITLDPAKYGADEFKIDGFGGGVTALGTGGSLTGRGADLIVIDDPVKNGEEAQSPAMRAALYEWFRSTLYTRLEPGGSIIIVMTRWNNEDLTGRLMKEGGWEQISLPVFAGADCPLGRKPGEPLWRERFDTSALEDIRRSIGSYWFESLYNQKPQNPDGGIFKKEFFRFYRRSGSDFVYEDISGETQTTPEAEIRNYITCDLAVRTSADSDYTVMAVFGIDRRRNVFVREIIRTKCSTLRHIELLKELNSVWQPDVIGIESVQYQYALVESALSAGLPVKALKPSGDKISRFIPAAAKAEAGRLFFPSALANFDEVRSELLAFPNSPHDDVVDCFSYIFEIIPPAVSSILPLGKKRNRIDE